MRRPLNSTRNSWSNSRATSCWIASAVFFLGGLRFDLQRPLFADAGIELHELAAQLLELAELSHFALGFAQRGRSRQRLGDGLAAGLIGEAGIGTVRGLTGAVAAAVRLAAPPRGVGNRTAAQIAQLADLADDVGALLLQLLEGIRHGSSLLSPSVMHTQGFSHNKGDC